MDNEEWRQPEPAISPDAGLYTVRQAANVLERSERRVQQMCGRGELNCWRDGQSWIIDKESVHSYLDEHGPSKRSGPRSKAGDSARVMDLEHRVRRLEREISELGGRLSALQYVLAEMAGGRLRDRTLDYAAEELGYPWESLRRRARREEIGERQAEDAGE